ncbi:MAG: SurA N-terminal domain-containing protein [Caulobacterales bacterium]
MLAGMRKGLGRFGALIILVPLIVAFAIWGIGDVFKGSTSDAVATVNGEGISAREFTANFERGLRRVQQQAQEKGETITADDARKRGFDTALLNDMIVAKALDQAAKKQHFTISDKALATQIRNLPAFQDGLKRFDKVTYERMLADVGYTRKTFEEELRSDLISSQLGAAAGAGALLPTAFLVQELKMRSETRSVRYVRVPGSAIPAPAIPIEADIKKFYDEQGGALYAVPEYRSSTVALLKPQDFAAKVNVPEADIKAQLDARRDEFAAPEKRSFQQLPVTDAAVAAQIAARAKKGETLTAIAASLKIDPPLAVADQPKSNISDPKIADAVFAAKKGEAIGPITGALGASSIIVIDAITPAAAMDEAKARAQIRGELAEDQAKTDLFDTLKTMEDQMSGGASLEKAAQAAGVGVMSFEPIDRQGLTATREPIEALVPEKIRAALFGAQQGQQTEADSLEDGTYFIVRPDKIQPADKMPLEKVKNDIGKRLYVQRRIEAIEKKATAFVDDAKAKGGLDKAAAAQGLKVVTREKPLHRGETDPVFNERVSAAVFAGGLNDTVVGPTPDGGFIAAEIETITREDPRANPALLLQIQQSAQGKFGGEIAKAYQSAVMARSKVKTDQKRFDAINGRGEDQEAP